MPSATSRAGGVDPFSTTRGMPWGTSTKVVGWSGARAAVWASIPSAKIGRSGLLFFLGCAGTRVERKRKKRDFAASNQQLLMWQEPSHSKKKKKKGAAGSSSDAL